MTTRRFVAALVLTSVCFVLGRPGQKGEERISATMSKFGLHAPEQCSSDYHCHPNYCCVISGSRFAIPTCQPLRQSGEACRPGVNKMTNKTLAYPDGSEFHIDEAHYYLCPCLEDLFCSRIDGSCQTYDDYERKAIEEFMNTNNFNYLNNS